MRKVPDKTNADYIAAAVTAVPLLIKRISALRAAHIQISEDTRDFVDAEALRIDTQTLADKALALDDRAAAKMKLKPE